MKSINENKIILFHINFPCIIKLGIISKWKIPATFVFFIYPSRTLIIGYQLNATLIFFHFVDCMNNPVWTMSILLGAISNTIQCGLYSLTSMYKASPLHIICKNLHDFDSSHHKLSSLVENEQFLFHIICCIEPFKRCIKATIQR